MDYYLDLITEHDVFFTFVHTYLDLCIIYTHILFTRGRGCERSERRVRRRVRVYYLKVVYMVNSARGIGTHAGPHVLGAYIHMRWM